MNKIPLRITFLSLSILFTLGWQATLPLWAGEVAMSASSQGTISNAPAPALPAPTASTGPASEGDRPLPPQGPDQGASAPLPQAEAQAPALRFTTPDAAVQALIEAAATEGPEALLAVLGPDLAELVSGDPVADAADRRWFVENARLSAQIEDETADSAWLVIGPEDWPFPIPLFREEQGWYFDTAAGADEILNRRIGRNELFTLATLRAVVEAQREYAAADPQGAGKPTYARFILSSPGQRNGLYWPTQPGEPESPLGPALAEAAAMGYDITPSREGPRPFHGYFYKILSAQGDEAPGGARNYLEGDRLIGGFGLLAWPARYGESGIMTFQVNQRGLVYERDLGEDTAALAAAIAAYDPGEGWLPAVD
ncbi:MAG: DUF2950 domain-containing protein [Gammaproteobacteria bacterium]|nr:DUF2950 domain-containing protein [Gammaproteobacteria bacterium]